MAVVSVLAGGEGVLCCFYFVVAPLDSLLVARQRWFLQYIFVSPTYPFVLWVSQGKQSEHR